MDKKSQGGFTLIELIIVIVIIGILAAVAIPQFVDLSDEAKTARLEGIGGALAAASVINYANCKADNSSGNTVAGCEDLVGQAAGVTTVEVADGVNPAAGSFGIETSAAAVADGATATCELRDDEGNQVTFTAIGSANCS